MHTVQIILSTMIIAAATSMVITTWRARTAERRQRILDNLSR